MYVTGHIKLTGKEMTGVNEGEYDGSEECRENPQFE
jgi:hypothetical protein